MDNNRIRTTELDFDSIKENLKEFMRGQSQFSDYDFEGSGLSILLDVLAYNTHYNALYTNLAVNEAFLDSASKRSSVVSKAKELGYTPRSTKAARATVDLVLINNTLSLPEFVELPALTPFKARIDQRVYTFTNLESAIAYRSNNEYRFENINLIEGTYLEFRYVADRTGAQSFTIPNPNVDTSTIKVFVQPSAQTSETIRYYSAVDLINIGSDDPVFFIKEVDNGLYQVEFGDGVLGRPLTVGNVVTVEYIVCNGAAANTIRSFTYGGSISNGFQPFVITKVPSFGGSAAESIESIKWNAPRSYSAQNRCVTIDDYRTTISSLYPNARSINVWGGEQNNPPAYGRVFISIQPTQGENLSDDEKDFILNEILAPRRVVTVYPKIVDPSYLYIEVNTHFYFDKTSNRRAVDLAASVRQAIEQYNDQQLNRFESILKHSVLTTTIDRADSAIKSSVTTLKIHKEIEPEYNILTDYLVNIGNPIKKASPSEPSITSSGIRVINVSPVVYIEDRPSTGRQTGSLVLFYYQSGTKVVVKEIGQVNYTTGSINITGLMITGLEGESFKLVILPESFDVASSFNQVVSILPSLTTVTPVVDTPANTYKFTSIRS